MDTQQQIKSFLDDIEKRYQITILLAIESGSRAWGFPSSDSDYDIRLVYHHPKDWYISPFKKRNVIENIFEGDLDAAGWDITKCLQLLYKGNAPLYEWLHSPVIYREKTEALSFLKDLSDKAFDPKLAFYHYISLTKKKLLNDKTKNNPKAFLYALRALLCAQWVADNQRPAPVEFSVLVERYISDTVIENKISTLLASKALSFESQQCVIDAELFNFTEALFRDLEGHSTTSSGLKMVQAYDEVLLKTLAFSEN